MLLSSSSMIAFRSEDLSKMSKENAEQNSDTQFYYSQTNKKKEFLLLLVEQGFLYKLRPQ